MSREEMVIKMMEITKLKRIIENKYLKKGDFILASGKKSNLYFDIKSLVLDPVAASLVARELEQLILGGNNEYKKAIIIGGLELGAALLAPLMAYRGFRTFVLRKQDKEYGLQSRLIGGYNLKWIDHVFILDDVITSGNSVKCVENYFSTHCSTPVCIIDRSEDGNYLSLFKEKDFV